MFRNRTDFAIRLLHHLHPASPVTLQTIAAAEGVSVSYAEQIAAPLRKAGIIAGIRGPGGGYILAMELGQVYIARLDNLLYGNTYDRVYIEGLTVLDVAPRLGKCA